MTLSNKYLFQENITFLGEIILFQKVPYEGIWVIQIPFPTTSVQSHSKVMQFKWFFPVLVHMMKIWALQLHTLYCCLAIKKDIIKKTRGRKELFSKEIEGTVSLTFLLDLMKRAIMYYVSNATKRENDFQMIHQYHSIKITSQCFLYWRVKCRISSLSL